MVLQSPSIAQAGPVDAGNVRRFAMITRGGGGVKRWINVGGLRCAKLLVYVLNIVVGHAGDVVAGDAHKLLVCNLFLVAGRQRCRASGTFRIWIIFDMLRA